MKPFRTKAVSWGLALCFASFDALASDCKVLPPAASPYNYPVVLQGPSALFGLPVRNFVAFSFKRDANESKSKKPKWQKIPLQIDERNNRGEFVLEGGLPFTKDSDDFRMDANDEFVFHGNNIGERFTQKDLQSKEIATWVRKSSGQWRLDLCNDSKDFGAVLVLAMPHESRDIVNVAVNLNVEQKKINAKQYRYEFNNAQPALLGQIFLNREKGEMEAIAGSSFLMIAQTPWYMPDIYLGDKSFQSEIESWQVGPVRTIVAVGVKFKKFLSLFNWHMFSELVFYENMFQIPTEIQFPFDANKILKPGSGMVYALNFHQPHEWNITTNMQKIPQDGPAWFAKNVAGQEKQKMYFAQGQHQSRDWSFFVKVRVDEEAATRFNPPLLVQHDDFKDEKIKKAWPGLKRMSGDLGVFLDVSKVNKGAYDFGLDLVLRTGAYQSFTDYGSIQSYWQPLFVNNTISH